jgi:hypothetical protein
MIGTALELEPSGFAFLGEVDIQKINERFLFAFYGFQMHFLPCGLRQAA